MSEEDIDRARRKQMGIIAEEEITGLTSRSRLDIMGDVLRLDWEDIDLGSTIGYGGFSQVFRAQIQMTSDADGAEIGDKEYALKCLSPNTMARTKSFKTGAVDLVIEATILCRLSHPNVIKLHGYYGNSIRNSYLESERGYFLVIDLLADTLRNKIDKYRLQNPKMRKTSRDVRSGSGSGKYRSSDSHKPNSGEALERIKSIGVDVAKGMEYLHSKGVVLRDLKPDNVGFDHSGVPKIFDLGFAREFHTLKPKEVAGSLRYMAPEIALGQPTEFASDVYSFGVLLWEMTTLEKPYKHIHDRDEFIESIMINGWRPSSSHMPSTALRKLVKECWDAEHTRRPTFSKVVKILKVETSLVATHGKRGSSGMPLPRTTTFSDTSAITRKNSLGKISSISKKTGNSFRNLMGFGKKNQSGDSMAELQKQVEAVSVSDTSSATATSTPSSSLSMQNGGNKNASFGSNGTTKVNPMLAQALLGQSAGKERRKLGGLKKPGSKPKKSLYRAKSNNSMPNFFEE